MPENAPVSNGKKITDLKDFSRLTSNGNSKQSKRDKNGEHQPDTDCSSPEHISPPTSAPPDSKSKASSGLDGVDEEEVIGYSHFNAVSAAVASTSPQHGATEKQRNM